MSALMEAMKKKEDDDDEDDYDDEDADTWDDEESEEESADSEDDWAEDTMQMIRVAHGGKNRLANVGYHTIEIYYPQFYFKQIEMEEWDADPSRYGPSVIGKYTKGVGQIEARYPTDDEDPVSYAMTATHRLLERIERDGFNETARYSVDGKAHSIWNAVGRLDIGSESLIDRSKSMKAYLMDMFERFGDAATGLGNIEGVDMYNACYGGQAAHLCCLNWVESDRWDGRYAICIPTDISDAGPDFMFVVGAATAAGLIFPDAPLAHYSDRCSAILHRFDFFKPVGWHHMGPVTDGKYSIAAYMECIDICYGTLRKKSNDQRLLSITDYNVFHTGGGYHVVKKAFDRVLRNDNPKILADERMRMVDSMLVPSCHILKIIGPCHTVSSFLNTSSLAMNEWDKAIGKVLMVFTYGSGCASSMYRMLFNDIPFFDPFPIWKLKFYQDALYMHPGAGALHNVYVETWMKFDYLPHARRDWKFGIHTYEEDVYYLMEIDPWGRRFYHRGGMKTGDYSKEHTIRVDVDETRKMRKHYGQLPGERDDEEDKKLQGTMRGQSIADQPKETFGEENALEEKWKELEFELTHIADGNAGPIETECWFKNNPEQKIKVIENYEPNRKKLEKSTASHSYQIVGSWTDMKTAEDMQGNPDGSFTFEVTLGGKLWHKFYMVQDGNMEKRIGPAARDAYKDNPPVGPHPENVVSDEPKCWLLDGRSVDWVSDQDKAEAGTRYRIIFTWKNVKRISWVKLPGLDRSFSERSRYSIVGSWTNWECEPLLLSKSKGGREIYTLDVEMKAMGLKFQIVCNDDKDMLICPNIIKKATEAESGIQVQGPVDSKNGKDRTWEIKGSQGDTFKIMVEVPASFEDDMMVTWEKTGQR
mmetsp:Transcript_155323/g.282450  ORF Transcript_155323/g.282450 Transcript_155323/m.282450 type:complete len:872 (-) Transcript_155323:187-2802(-)